jgi:hypothetical protein
MSSRWLSFAQAGGDSPISRLRVPEALEGHIERSGPSLTERGSGAGGRRCAARVRLASRRTRSRITPARRRVLYGKLGVRTGVDAVARVTALGLLEQTQSPM